MELSRAERRVAEALCKGFTVQEAAESLFVSPDTVKSAKKSIFLKLNIKKETELVMWMACKVLGKNFNLKDLREKGISLLLSLTFLIMAVTYQSSDDMRQMRVRRSGRRYEQVVDGGQDDE